MAKATYSVPVSEVYGESTALATTLAYGDIINVRKGFKGLQFYCAAEFKFLTTPRIAKVILYDHSAGIYSDLTSQAIDNNSATVVSLGTMTTSDQLWVGCVGTYLGLSINVSTVNAVTATFVETYWNGSVQTQLPDTISDGTISGGVTLAQDGLYTWGLPGAGLWQPQSVNKSELLYYTRFVPSAALTAGTSIEAIVAINKAANYGYFPAAMVHDFNYDEDLVGGLQFLAVSGTPTVYINHLVYKG